MENKETEKWGEKEEKEKWEKKEMENRGQKEKKENIENVLCIINYWSHLKAWDSRISNMLSILFINMFNCRQTISRAVLDALTS